ncbi:fibronectin type III domain-containing protein [Chitinophaga barathri]|uniref:Fibronectin type-III domain-containing protein n=1 Tax=Chitinophaga barathri TaxID=1647451 RepID=A0A3N4N498_9BACT|nr:hypothetical protein [Chitinophaga barathri]RPD42463.1 hypothetical protein EG028_04620 [Chitinophaga barathri]
MTCKIKIRASLPKKWLLAGMGLLWSVAAMAQAKPGNGQHIAVLARPAKDSIMLRWAPVSATLWKLANQHGYVIKRFTILRDGKLLPKPEDTVLTKQPLKPLPLAAWEQVVKQHEKYGSIVAQALYGEEFELTTEGGQKDVMAVYHRAQEQESRHGFTLFATDQSFPVAKAAALGYVDKSAKANEKYLYQVFVAPNNAVRSDTGFVFTGAADYQPVPAPHDLEAANMHKSVLLSWNHTSFRSIFNAYWIERSDDGGQTFARLNDEPVLNTGNEGDTAEQQRFFRIDTTIALDKKYIYRIRGITPFGEVSPPSDTAQVAVTPITNARPSIKEAVVMNNKQVVIQWEMPDHTRLKAFEIERAAAATKPYAKISTQPLRENDTVFTDISPLPSNYYRIKAIMDDGQTHYSLARFVQMEDSIPPAPPTGLAGMISDSGVVSLSWKPNTERDLYAYRVFRANAPDAEFVQVTKEPISEAKFVDTVEVKTLTRHVYYKLVALDGHYNPSGFSEMLTVKRPDVVPPVPPQFTDVSAATGGITLQWQPSTSKDVASYNLERAADTAWLTLQSFSVKETVRQYADTAARPGVSYRYRIVAVDESGLRGQSQEVTASAINMSGNVAKPVVKASIDRDNKTIVLKWGAGREVAKSWLYRAEEGKPYRLYKTLPGNTAAFTDDELLINTQYRYKLKIFDQNNNNAMSEEVRVNY